MSNIPLKYVKNIYTFAICYRTGCTIAVKSGKLSGHADTVMSIVSADALGLYKNRTGNLCHILPKVQGKQGIIFNRYIPRRGNNTLFCGKLNTGIDPAINLDLVKCITKNHMPKMKWKDGGRVFN